MAIAALDNLVKGASGQAVQCANLALGLPETDRPARGRGATRDASPPRPASSPPAWPAASSASGDPDLSLVATADGRPVAAAAVFTTNQATAAPVSGQPRPTCRPPAGRAAAVVLNSGNANAATGAAGRGRRRAHVRARRPPGSAAAPSEVLVCSTGLIGIPLPDRRRSWPASPPCVAGRHAPTAAPGAAEAIMTTDTHRQGGRGRRRRASPSAAWPRGRPCSAPNMATMLAVLTTDAAAEPGRAAAGACAGAVAAVFNELIDRRLHVDQRHRDPPGQRPRPGVAPDQADLTEAPGRGVRRPGRPDGRRRRGRHQGRPGPGRPARPPTPTRRAGARKVAESQLVKCSLVRRGPLLGPDRERARLRRHRLRPRPGPGQLRRHHGVPRAASAVDRDDADAAGRGHGRAPRSRSSPTSASATARRPMLTDDLTHAYIDENMSTS